MIFLGTRTQLQSERCEIRELWGRRDSENMGLGGTSGGEDARGTRLGRQDRPVAPQEQCDMLRLEG